MLSKATIITYSSKYASCYGVAILKLYQFVSDDFLKGAALYHSDTFFISKRHGIVLIG